MAKKRRRSEPEKKTEADLPKKEGPGREIPIGKANIQVPWLDSGLAYPLRLHTKLEPRQGKALRALRDGFQDTDARCRTGAQKGREVMNNDQALRLLLDLVADGIGL